MSVFEEKGKPEYSEKNLLEQGENQAWIHAVFHCFIEISQTFQNKSIF